METTTITHTFPLTPAALIAQCMSLLIPVLLLALVFYVLHLLRRIAKAQEESSRHLAEIARSARKDENRRE